MSVDKNDETKSDWDVSVEPETELPEAAPEDIREALDGSPTETVTESMPDDDIDLMLTLLKKQTADYPDAPEAVEEDNSGEENAEAVATHENKSPRWLVPAAILAVVLVVVLVRLAGLAVDRYKAHKLVKETVAPYTTSEQVILPNVTIGEVEVGGMTRDEAAEALSAYADEVLIHTVTVALPDRSLTFTTELHDLAEDISDALDLACAYGRDDSSMEGMYSAVQDAKSETKVIPFTTEASWDETYILDVLQETAEDAYAEPIQSTVEINTTDQYISVIKGTPGKYLDVGALEGKILKAFEAEDYEPFTFAYTEIPLDTVDLTTLLSTYTWSAQNAVYDVETETIIPSKVGYEPDISLWKARYLLEKALPGEELRVNFLDVEPEMTTQQLESMLFRDVLYSYGSVYASNANRTENLRLACAEINGTVIQPGEVFSFNETVGQRTAAKGYRSATVYVSGKTEPQTGGGICQVASTIYYCCLYAELEIVERQPHMYKVTYVPYGMDATVYWGSLDYKFRNNTDYPIKINAYLANGRCYIELIGTDVNRHRVEMESVAITGLKYRVYRYVYDEEDNLLAKEDLGVSAYRTHP